MRSCLGGLTALVLFACPIAAHAARSFDNCTGYIDALPATLSTQGTWCLRKDVATAISSGAAITIATNNVTIDCNDFKIGGLAAGVGTHTDGVRGVSRSNVTVRNCNVRGFSRGIVLEYEDFMMPVGNGHVIENNRFNDNTFAGIWVQGDGSMVRQNLVVDTGGAPGSGSAYGIVSTGSIDIIDNTVSNVFVSAGVTNGNAFGINADQNGGSIQGNRIRGLLPRGTGRAWGLRSQTANDFFARVYPTALRENDITLTVPSANSVGLDCGTVEVLPAGGRARDNVIQGFQTAIAACGDGGGNDASL